MCGKKTGVVGFRADSAIAMGESYLKIHFIRRIAEVRVFFRQWRLTVQLSTLFQPKIGNLQALKLNEENNIYL